MALMALVCPSWISTPEWPPVKPSSVILTAMPSAGSQVTGTVISVRIPPEQIGEGRLAVAQGRTLTYDPSLELVVEKVENTYLPFEDLDFKHLWQRDCLWRIVLKKHATEAEARITVK